MRKATATYHAPDGDAKSCNIAGVNFNDGEEVEINSDENPHLLSKLQGNQHFDIHVGEDDERPRRGRPPNRDMKKGIEEARDHDFEADRRAGLEGRKEPASAE